MHTCSTRCTFTRSRANNSHCRWKRRCIILESFIAPTARRQIVVRLYHKHAYFRARARCYFRCPGIETRWVSYSNVRQHYVTTRQLRYLRIRKAACTHRATVLRIRCFPLSSQTLEASTRCAWNCRSLDGQFDKRREKINTLYKIRDDYAIR